MPSGMFNLNLTKKFQGVVLVSQVAIMNLDSKTSCQYAGLMNMNVADHSIKITFVTYGYRVQYELVMK